MTNKTYTFSKRVTTTYEIEISEKLMQLLKKCYLIKVKEDGTLILKIEDRDLICDILILMKKTLHFVNEYELSEELEHILNYLEEIEVAIDKLECIEEE